MMETSLSSQDRFAATRWSQVLRAAGSATAGDEDALTELAQRYCYPVYAYVRRCGHEPAIAGEITGVFLREITVHAGAAQAQRHFRRYLFERLNTFLGGNWRKIEAEAARDDAVFLVPPDLEARYQRDAAGATSPEIAFQRAFALEVLARALQRLQGEAEQTGHQVMYQALQEFIALEPAPGVMEALGARLSLPPLALVVALKRLRQRFRELAALELADTVTTGSDLSIEQGNLHSVLRPVS
jgi:RNA polymerase sigma-70 factor (ECF subfamily)